MRIGVVGVGGVGGLVGGLLARAGHEVAFVARGAQLAALRAGGLRIEGPRASFHLERVEVAEDPLGLAPCDVVLVCTKAWQVAALGPRLGRLLGPAGFAVPLQNGVESAGALAAALGEERVVGGLIHVFARIEAPGFVRHVAEPLRVTIGERAGGSSPRVEALAAALRAALVDALVSPDVEAAAWEKFLFIDPVSLLGAAARAPIGATRSHPETRALLAAAMEEVVAVGRARGVRWTGDVVARALGLVDAVPADSTTSLQRDLQAGRPSELDDQAGSVIRMAQGAGVAVPVHAALHAVLLPQERAARRPPP
jgi:2-dehydropantoate 2-reductase